MFDNVDFKLVAEQPKKVNGSDPIKKEKSEAKKC